MKFVVSLLLIFSSSLLAQEEEVPKHMRFVPLGEVPTWEEKIVDGIRIQQEHKPGDMPPNDIMVEVRGASSESTRMYLRKFTKWFTFSGALEQVKIEQGKAGSVSPFINSPMPTALHTLGVLYRDSEEMTWLKPKIKVLRDDLTVFPLGTMRFVNLAHLKVLTKIGDAEPLLVEPGATVVHPIPQGGVTVQVTAVVGDGEYQRIFNNDVVMRENQRVQSFIFKAQSPPPANPVKFHFRPEIYEPPTNPAVNEESNDPESRP